MVGSAILGFDESKVEELYDHYEARRQARINGICPMLCDLALEAFSGCFKGFYEVPSSTRGAEPL